MQTWKQNLVTIWLAQFLSIAGFAFSLPFVPFYMQDLGVTDPTRLKIWVAIFGALAPLMLAIFSPIWGALADRFGRRLMLLRANFAACLLVTLMGVVTSVEQLVVLRAIQGALCGTMTASQTLVSVGTPDDRGGFALGALSAAIFSGMMFGQFVGGFFAETIGYRQAFYVSGLILLISTLIVVFGVTEAFVRPDRPNRPPAERHGAAQRLISDPARQILRRIGPAVPILILMGAMSFVRHFDQSFLPLLVQEIQGSLKGASSMTGMLGAIGGVAGFLAGIMFGRLADRIPPPRIGIFSALGAGLLMFPQGLAYAFPLLFCARFGTIFFAGGLDPVFQIWLGKTTPKALRGEVFGWAGSAKAMGWMMAPLLSGVVATTFSIRWIFLIGGLIYLLLIPLIVAVVRYIDPKSAANDDPPA